MTRRHIAQLVTNKMKDVGALLQAHSSSDKRDFVADEFFESVKELCEKDSSLGSFEEVRGAMKTKAENAHQVVLRMLKNRLEPRSHAERRDELRRVVNDPEKLKIFLDDTRYVTGRLMNEIESSLKKWPRVPPAVIICVVDEMYREIRERFEFISMSRDVVELYVWMDVEAVDVGARTSLSLSLSLSYIHTHIHTYVQMDILKTSIHVSKRYREHKRQTMDKMP